MGSKFGSVTSPFPFPMTLLSLVGSCFSVTHRLNNVILSTPHIHTKGKVVGGGGGLQRAELCPNLCPDSAPLETNNKTPRAEQQPGQTHGLLEYTGLLVAFSICT
ncbi:transmembrane emp24 domain-containing protein 6 [Platysternon megacephalum]|uniref:Transmembrane emp24 domain-containing protein 6 n=1 Tax=Platysternon megacephalum TaxID=55544 RepID=A0A4D9EBT8_9SAUR|nr:transmembrane emp24 domain-containing protein 6 [Platysternon megacephalum]